MTTEHLRFLKKIRRRRRMVVFLRILILFLFLLQWEICADTGVVDSFIFSSPSRIVTCFLKMTEDGSVFHHIGITLYETLVELSSGHTYQHSDCNPPLVFPWTLRNS